jgi:hypothetical protein
MAPTNTRTYAKRKGRPTADPDPDPDTPGPSLTPPEALNHSPKRRRTVITTDKSHDETPSTPPSGAARPRRLLNKPKKKRIVDAQPASEPPRPPVFPQSRPPVRHHKPKENAHATARSGTGGFLRDESAYIHLQRPPSRFSPLRRTPLAAALRSKTPDPNLPSVPASSTRGPAPFPSRSVLHHSRSSGIVSSTKSRHHAPVLALRIGYSWGRIISGRVSASANAKLCSHSGEIGSSYSADATMDAGLPFTPSRFLCFTQSTT